LEINKWLEHLRQHLVLFLVLAVISANNLNKWRNIMASREEVRVDMNIRLSLDNFVSILKAGDAWEQMDMGFYYLTEQQVDIATKKIMLAILEREQKTLPDAKWTELRKRINLGTGVSDAIDTITDISADAS
jgi:hypothetical protein